MKACIEILKDMGCDLCDVTQEFVEDLVFKLVKPVVYITYQLKIILCYVMTLLQLCIHTLAVECV